MKNRRAVCAALVASCLTIAFAAAGVWAQDEAKSGEDDKHEDALTLEQIFPKKSLYGPSASGMEFSYDGRFAAFLYRPYVERRHGSDLYIYDTGTGESRRITSVSRMAEFQEKTREVLEDREKKAKAAGIRLSRGDPGQSASDAIVGHWHGVVSRSSSRTVRKDQDCSISIIKAKGQDDQMSGEIEAGIVRLAIRELSIDDESGHFEGMIGDEDSDIEGTIEGELSVGVLEGTVAVKSPRLRFSFRVEPGKGEDQTGPRGVLGATGERMALGDVVLADDADDEDEADEEDDEDKEEAPRYSGVGSIEWSPVSTELIFVSRGDLYLLTIDVDRWTDGHKPDETGDEEQADEDDEEAEGEQAANEDEDSDDDLYRGDLIRLTVTRERERDVQFLPDGSGYTYLRDGALIRVSWGDHVIRQLDPELPDGERMVGYRISPDQSRLVFLTSKGSGPFSGGVEINIVNYRNRFAQIRKVMRKMSDDPIAESESSIYLYDLGGHTEEEGTLKKVFTRKRTGPRDVMAVPTWALDSSKVAFAAYEQSSGQVHILEAGFKPEEEDEEEQDAADEDEGEEAAEAEEGKKDDEEEEEEEEEANAEAEQEREFVIEDARVVYKFLHNGGPTTPRMIIPQYLADNRRLVFLTEISGYRQLHVLDPTYERLTQLTDGPFEVYPFDISEDHARLFVTSTKGDPTQRHIFIVDPESGEMAQRSHEGGVYERAAISDDGSMVLALHADFGHPRELVGIDGEGEMIRLTESHPEETLKLSAVEPEYFTYENRHGQTIHGHMFKPADWSEQDKRPLLVYVYGGPLGERKMATRGSFSAPSYFFARYMTEVHGYVTATIDPRGSSGYGALFEKSNFEQVGVPQTEDLVDGARWLAKNQGVDEDRMALHGWSFGGFQTQMVMYTEPDVYAVGIAGAGPTEWENYNSWYSSGTIGPSRAGHTDLEKYSLLPLAKNLKGILLLVHGMEDSNVLYQDTVRVYRELLKAGKEANVELFLDPTGGHGLGGDVKTINRYRKYEDFLIRRLGEGGPAETTEAEDDDEEVGEGHGDSGDKPVD